MINAFIMKRAFYYCWYGEKRHRNWNDYCNDYGISFYPTVIPGFDDRAVRPELSHPVIPRNFKAMKSLMRKLNGLGIEDLYICSFNEWHENTKIEEV
jgi:hypothetical protein